MTFFRILVLGFLVIVLSGCETTSTRPYSASTENVLKMKQALDDHGVKLRLGEFSENPDIGPLNCRLSGPVDVSPGKTRAEYIRDALQTELFMADIHGTDAGAVITGDLKELDFSSTSPAKWKITLAVASNHSDGYIVETEYPFKTSFSAVSACRNVADAWGPAVQKTIENIVTHPDFKKLVGVQ